MRESRLLIQQFDPHRPVPGGIDTCIRGLVKYCPNSLDLHIVGVDSSRRFPHLGRWYAITLEGRDVQFMPVARLDPGNQKRRVPHSLRVGAGLLWFRPRRDQTVVQTHRIDVAAFAHLVYRGCAHVQFLHIDGQDGLGTGSDSQWKWAPSMYGRLESLLLPRTTDAVVFNAEGAKRLSSVASHVRFSPTWFDPETFFLPTQRADDGPVAVLWVGRIEPPKDPLLALEVLKALPVDSRMTMVGDGTLWGEAEAAVESLGLAGRVNMTGAVGKRQVAELMREHHVLLSTSHYEGFARVIVEALASGLPVVATQGGEPNGLVTDGRTGEHARERSALNLAQLVLKARCYAPADCRDSVQHLDARNVVASVLGTPR